MKRLLIIVVCILVQFVTVEAQEYHVNIGVDTNDVTKQKIVRQWHDYLQEVSNNAENIAYESFWREQEIEVLESPDLLASEGLLNPNLYGLRTKNVVLSIAEVDTNTYELRTMFYWANKSVARVLAVTKHMVYVRQKDIRFGNFTLHRTRNWNRRRVGMIEYVYPHTYEFDEDEAQKANEFLFGIVEVFTDESVKDKVTYFISKDCDSQQILKGFDYVVGMGGGKICGSTDPLNKVIYATSYSGENYKHELTNYLAPHFGHAHSIAFTGLTAYFSGDHAHMGESLLYHLERIDRYIGEHEVNLDTLANFTYMDGKTAPGYVFGALLCHEAIEQGNLPLLKRFLSETQTNEDFYLFLKNELGISSPDAYFRRRFEEVLREKNFAPYDLEVLK